MSTSDSQANWHWAEGIKFALEGVKLLFVLNGAASVSILTFVGNTHIGSGQLISSLVCFAVGAAIVVPAMIFAYLTQLHYGNASQGHCSDLETWSTAGTFHYWAYAFIALSWACFLIGMILGAYGLSHIASSIPPPCHT